MLVTYVDDLKLAGPVVNMAEGWTLIREVLDIDDPSPLDLVRGCQHEVQYAVNAGRPTSSQIPGPVSIMAYNMVALFRDRVCTYVELAGHPHPLRKVMTPFLVEDRRRSPVSRRASDVPESSWNTCPWCKHQYPGGSAPKICGGEAARRSRRP